MAQCRFRALSAFVVVAVLAASMASLGAQPLGTAFPYQGRLQDNGAPANGLYDFQFQIYSAAVAGAQVGPAIVRDDVAVSGGLFTTSLDFGGGVFTGSARWLEIAVRPGASGGAFTAIGGRQELQPTPNALFAAATGSIVPPVVITHAPNEPVVSVTATGPGTPGTIIPGISSFVDNTNAVRPAVKGEVNSIFGNFGTAGIFGVSSGTGGFAGLFHASHTNGNGPAIVAVTDGNGNAITANASKDGNAVEANIDGGGNALYAWVPTFATGRAIRANIFNLNNTSDVITATTVGNGAAVNARVDRVTGTSPALRGEVNSQFANFGTAGVYGVSSGTGGFGGLFYASNPAGNGPALIAIANGNGNAITANADNSGDGVETTVDGNGNALYAWVPNFATGRAIRAVNYNTSNANDVVRVENHRISGTYTTMRVSTGSPAAREARFATNAYAGYFVGDVHVAGALSKSSGTFKIDHPLDPANKYLSHSFVESPDMKNVYDGVATLDAHGEVVVTLPGYFEALNRDFRYQLTAVGAPAPSLHIASRISGGTFRIAGGTPGLDVSWQVTGIRKDRTALHRPVVVEEDKGDERGRYLDPAAFGLSPEQGIGWAPVQTTERTTERKVERPTPPADQQ